MLELLEVLRVQRHDFLNHLQVISGLIQLKKYDRAGEYIRQVGDELSQAGLLARLGCQRVVAEVLVAQLKANKRGITLECAVNSSMDKGIDEEQGLAEALRQMFDTAIETVNVSPYGHGTLGFEVKEKKGEYLFQISFSCKEGEEENLQNRVSVITGAIDKIGGRFASGNTADGVTVFSLALPARQ